MGEAGARLQAERAQVLGDLARGALLAVGQLGVGVEVAAPVDDLLLQLLRGGRDLGPLRRRRVLGDERKRCGKQGEQQRAEAVCEAHGGVLRGKMRRCYRARGGDGRVSSRRVERSEEEKSELESLMRIS